MKIVDLYTPMQASLTHPYQGYEFFDTNSDFHFFRDLARNWEIDQSSIQSWLLSSEGGRQKRFAESFLKIAPAVVKKVESIFGRELPGVLVLMPSFGDFDGFARYDQGSHRVMLGIDFPDADVDYLRALTAHELSHVYRDHSEAVWSHLGKPLTEISREEYLEGGSAQEHLVSEGLATLFSQAIFPEIPFATHHYYERAEWEWCVANDESIDRALNDCLVGDEDVWSFYGSDRAGRGSPSRTQYYWAAKKISQWLRDRTGDDVTRTMSELISLHRLPASDYPAFTRKS